MSKLFPGKAAKKKQRFPFLHPKIRQSSKVEKRKQEEDAELGMSFISKLNKYFLEFIHKIIIAPQGETASRSLSALPLLSDADDEI